VELKICFAKGSATSVTTDWYSRNPQMRTLAREDAQYVRYVQVAALYVTGSASILLAHICPF